MTLPINPPFAPMEALPVLTIPGGGDWQYEPKWDGFRWFSKTESMLSCNPKKANHSIGIPRVIIPIAATRGEQMCDRRRNSRSRRKVFLSTIFAALRGLEERAAPTYEFRQEVEKT